MSCLPSSIPAATFSFPLGASTQLRTVVPDPTELKTQTLLLPIISHLFYRLTPTNFYTVLQWSIKFDISGPGTPMVSPKIRTNRHSIYIPEKQQAPNPGAQATSSGTNPEESLPRMSQPGPLQIPKPCSSSTPHSPWMHEKPRPRCRRRTSKTHLPMRHCTAIDYLLLRRLEQDGPMAIRKR